MDILRKNKLRCRFPKNLSSYNVKINFLILSVHCARYKILHRKGGRLLWQWEAIDEETLLIAQLPRTLSDFRMYDVLKHVLGIDVA